MVKPQFFNMATLFLERQSDFFLTNFRLEIASTNFRNEDLNTDWIFSWG